MSFVPFILGLFCTPDAVNITEKTPNQLSQPWAYCEAYRFISGIDEMALPCEMGLYFDFKNRGNGFPTGCPGLSNFDGTNWQSWSSIKWVKADPQCPLQSLAEPGTDQSTSFYMRQYALDQNLWLKDFSAAYDKMMANGYGVNALTLGVDQSKGHYNYSLMYFSIDIVQAFSALTRGRRTRASANVGKRERWTTVSSM